MKFDAYKTDNFFDEFFVEDGKPRSYARKIVKTINEMEPGELLNRQKAAEAVMFETGITFTLYSNEETQEDIIPFDILPRMIPYKEWEMLQIGLKQRVEALNAFVADVYGEQKILKDKVVPKDLVLGSKAYHKQLVGIRPPRDIWTHISGIDLVRDDQGEFLVLEDNMRCPSGVSYVLENRAILKRIFPIVFRASRIAAVEEYPERLLDMLEYLVPHKERPTVAVLTPGMYNSAFFEHVFLAREMGVDLVQGSDLVVEDDCVFMRTTAGLQQVDSIYRRLDDDFLDPESFRADSLLGVPGIMRAWKKGNVALVNAPGTGVADDKAIYSYVPQIIKYYLDQDAVLSNVETFLCRDKIQLDYVVRNLDKLVVKPVAESGGYGLLIGPQASKKEREAFKAKLLADPKNYIAQPVVSLSRAPVVTDKGELSGRHVDLRPFILYGQDIFVLNGGLTRVALKEGSLVVNSSQGGGSKDTWVIEPSKPKGSDA
ncbi:MAG: circularly permuted type 2 ATP-grasp protein [bacterium]|nr:circularly permuted type 2 ATP-grasp protein [bacterium]